MGNFSSVCSFLSSIFLTIFYFIYPTNTSSSFLSLSHTANVKPVLKSPLLDVGDWVEDFNSFVGRNRGSKIKERIPFRVV
ncbi:hypothetical protein GALMADRAFT_411861 [Galerina marginata CBS 339.88]|uniref:Uncharacterized protein n=1 Tax=Galerina marginata (strain CBS 339.88) TaxID=685588 RepID=A0A067T5U9_GALM3|nr:hypothetical protein GALMADRAFT_411861 [Galerina marginata CBS 339.88]